MSENRKVKKAEYDVVVIGGGMAGICAALASARHGARTALVHDRHVLGGNASSEIRMHICGASENLAKPELEESGILHEIMLDNKSRNDYFNYSIWDMVLFLFSDYLNLWFNNMECARRLWSSGKLNSKGLTLKLFSFQQKSLICYLLSKPDSR